MNTTRRQLPCLSSVYGLRTTVYTVTTRKDLRIRRLHVLVYDDPAFFIVLDPYDLTKESGHFLLTDRLDDHVARDLKKLERPVGPLTPERGDTQTAVVVQYANRRCLPNELDTILFGDLEFVVIGRCILL